MILSDPLRAVGTSGAQSGSEFGSPLWGFHHSAHGLNLLLLDVLADQLTQTMSPGPQPPLAFFLAQVRAEQLFGPIPLQVAVCRQAQFHPSFHLAELAQAVVVQAQHALAFLEQKLYLPP